MRILVHLDGLKASFELEAWQPGTTLAMLLNSVGIAVSDGERLVVDRSTVAAKTPLHELSLLEGSLISRSTPTPVNNLHNWNVSVSAGLEVRPPVTLPVHRAYTLGRAPQSDLVISSISTSWHHCTLKLETGGVRIKDAGSTNGTFVDGRAVGDEGVLITSDRTVLLGGAAIAIRRSNVEPKASVAGQHGTPTPTTTVPFNRPPRPGTPRPPEPVEAPSPEAVGPASKFNVLSFLVPLVMAVVLVAALGNIKFALFALLSPLMAVGAYYEQRRRHTKKLTEEETRFTAALDTFRHHIASAAAEEAARRRDMYPDPATVLRRPALPSTFMWQRRPDAPDFLRLHIGVGDERWQPQLDTHPGKKLHDRVRAVYDASTLTAAPILADLNDAGVIGIVGDRDASLALARSLIAQAAVHCGPADLTISAFCDTTHGAEWDWLSWLPHTRQAATHPSGHWLSQHRVPSTLMLKQLTDGITALPTPRLLVVLDSEALIGGRNAPARGLLGLGRQTPESARERSQHQVSGIVLAASTERLPAACTTIVDVEPDATATVHHPQRLSHIDGVTLAGVSRSDAEDTARALARFEDPEFITPGTSLPSHARLPELLAAARIDASTISQLWASASGVSTPIGMGEDGVFTLDLVCDGPHGLVGGTTGSGKSEFLRSLVVGLAAHNDPAALNFILIDFKGGAAFSACERLPHTIGTISNLDAQLADRAIRALEAEMKRRQRLFAEAGEDVDTLSAYLATNPRDPLPRLLLVIDEFAMLAKDFPDVLASIVSIGAVGRTLGIHMILATQRPAGVVNDDILANTNLRVALRVQSREDSTNVIGVTDASRIDRSQSGRAYIKLGEGDITPIQSALVTGSASTGRSEQITVHPVGLFGSVLRTRTRAQSNASKTSDLDLFIDAIVAAYDATGLPPPRKVWPEPLGAQVLLSGRSAPGLPSTDIPHLGGVDGETVLVALADEPAFQRQRAAGWQMQQGNVLLVGVPGSGTSTALASIALSLTQSFSPDELDLLCLDTGSRDLSPLEHLPHTVAYAGASGNAKEQQVRFLRYLYTEFQRRRQAAEPQRTMVVLIDGLATLRDEFQDFAHQSLFDAFTRVYADGPGVGMHFAVATARAKAVPSAIDEVTLQRWVFRLADPYDYAVLGITGNGIPAPVPGRFVDVASRLHMHIATPGHGLEAAVRDAAGHWTHLPPKPTVLGVLPTAVPALNLAPSLRVSSEPIQIPIGIREDTLETATLELYEGEHAFIAGPPRSGKSTLLVAIASLLQQKTVEGSFEVWGICDRRSPLRHAGLHRTSHTPEMIPKLTASLRKMHTRVFLLIDDAERVDDTDHSLAGLLAAPPPHLTTVATGLSAEIRSLYNHWSRATRKARNGVLLQPDIDYDGELLGAKLPRHAPVAITPGRGYLCSGGTATLVQTMSHEQERQR